MNGGFPWLSTLLLLPILGCVIIQFIPQRFKNSIKLTTITLTGSIVIITLGLGIAYGRSVSNKVGIDFQFQERHDWISSIGASYHIGIDGISALLLILNATVFLLGAILLSTRGEDRIKLFCSLLLLIQTATIGILISLDLLLFYLFWESMLIPLYLILSNYGNSDAGRAALKFVIYTVAGSLCMLLSIIYLYIQTTIAGHGSFDLLIIMHNLPSNQSAASISLFGHSFSLFFSPLTIAFLGFCLAFAVKIPLVPLHTWLPDLYEATPIAILVFLAGIISKLGAYGFIRFGLGIFLHQVQQAHLWISAIAVISIIYGALAALGEQDIKRIVGFASISHLGFVVLGIFTLNANGISGATIQMINHGIIIVALFLVVDWIEKRTGTRELSELSGLEKRMPQLYVFFLVTSLASLGMPGLNSFVGEFSIMLGAFQSNWILAAAASGGMLLAACYMLRLHQGLMHESLQPTCTKVTDLQFNETILAAVLTSLIVSIGVFPRPLGAIVSPTSANYSASIASSDTPNTSIALPVTSGVIANR